MFVPQWFYATDKLIEILHHDPQQCMVHSRNVKGLGAANEVNSPKKQSQFSQMTMGH